MPRRIGLTIPSLSGPSIPEQEEAIGSLAEIFLTVSHPTARRLLARCRRIRIDLAAGDRIVISDSIAYPRETATLVKLIADLTKRGISIYFAKPDLLFDPADPTNPAQKALDLFDRQWRAAARERQLLAAQSGAAPGRPRRLTSEQIARIPALMAEPGATSDSVARQLNIGRATLYRYLTRKNPSTDEG